MRSTNSFSPLVLSNNSGSLEPFVKSSIQTILHQLHLVYFPERDLIASAATLTISSSTIINTNV